MRWTESAARMEEIENAFKFFMGNLKRETTWKTQA
jgi:hypothetical protein